MKNKNIKIVAVTATLTLSLFSGMFLIATRGEPYQHAIRYLRTNDRISELLGHVEHHRLHFWGKYFARSNTDHGRAEFTITLRGSAGTGVASVALNKRSGQWKVTGGKLEYGSGRAAILAPEN